MSICITAVKIQPDGFNEVSSLNRWFKKIKLDNSQKQFESTKSFFDAIELELAKSISKIDDDFDSKNISEQIVDPLQTSAASGKTDEEDITEEFQITNLMKEPCNSYILPSEMQLTSSVSSVPSPIQRLYDGSYKKIIELAQRVTNDNYEGINENPFHPVSVRKNDKRTELEKNTRPKEERHDFQASDFFFKSFEDITWEECQKITKLFEKFKTISLISIGGKKIKPRFKEDTYHDLLIKRAILDLRIQLVDIDKKIAEIEVELNDILKQLGEVVEKYTDLMSFKSEKLESEKKFKVLFEESIDLKEKLDYLNLERQKILIKFQIFDSKSKFENKLKNLPIKGEKTQQNNLESSIY
ncbi:hypothetical protein WICMUC_000388 [Wickerhamomyces mucosus]|uniref:Uncharacterized protein n=1 Tax=Wickerhamomyces mucosus TaxID=1378264 RepID=A0A9P8PXU4_9ASCO|nr:hypothetical protein WICMUC_000388 [Wickerhamomyces mucosus]